MTDSRIFYRRAYAFAFFLFGIFYRFEITGGENIPRGAAMVCANHSDWLDPIFLEFAFGKDDRAHIIGKVELFRIPGLSWLIRKLGMIAVDRGAADISAMRQSLQYLKNGEKVAIFPEGHRVPENETADAGSGAIWLADRAGAPVLPMYIQRRKRVFSKIRLVIGSPYTVGGEGRRLNAGDRAALSAQLMDKITALKPL
ncbi:MAG: 1-acyl-sn-glycerol-3-phosphate acyltransferase [Oscillospiraceae bacterium]|jgi:1-acyl-sn-glycerol-3-phosphate acyltransferase|nr:1-acyl-sn-glycerol-3-phosphate acyltransferase [Oscillospiraceae bacterium]